MSWYNILFFQCIYIHDGLVSYICVIHIPSRFNNIRVISLPVIRVCLYWVKSEYPGNTACTSKNSYIWVTLSLLKTPQLCKSVSKHWKTLSHKDVQRTPSIEWESIWLHIYIYRKANRNQLSFYQTNNGSY